MPETNPPPHMAVRLGVFVEGHTIRDVIRRLENIEYQLAVTDDAGHTARTVIGGDATWTVIVGDGPDREEFERQLASWWGRHKELRAEAQTQMLRDA